MQNKTSVPENVLKYRPCRCTRIRNDNGIYRVYRYKAEKLPSGKWSNSAGQLIGKIIPDVGFIPNKKYREELETKKEAVSRTENAEAFDLGEITDHAYGQYALLMSLSEDVLCRLKDCFPEEKAVRIYAYALILCANGFVNAEKADDYFQESFLSVLYKDHAFKTDGEAIISLLHELGMKGNPVAAFGQCLLEDSSKTVALGSHTVRPFPNCNDFGKQNSGINRISMLTAFDIENNMPLMYGAYRDFDIDNDSRERFLSSRQFKNIKFVADGGFFSPELLDLMSADGCRYIVPVSESNRTLKRTAAALEYPSGEFVYMPGTEKSARVVYHEECIGKDTRMIFFKDVDENNGTRKFYRQQTETGETGYTEKDYDKNKDLWGVYVLQTNTDESVPEVFADYKRRESIRTYDDCINGGCIGDPALLDYYNFQGFTFVALVSGMIESRLDKVAASLQKENISARDILVKSGIIRMVNIKGGYRLCNVREKDLALFREIGFDPYIIYSGLCGNMGNK